MALNMTSRDQGSELLSFMMIPQMTADLTHSENELTLMPDGAMGSCHARRLRSVLPRLKNLNIASGRKQKKGMA